MLGTIRCFRSFRGRSVTSFDNHRSNDFHFVTPVELRKISVQLFPHHIFMDFNRGYSVFQTSIPNTFSCWKFIFVSHLRCPTVEFLCFKNFRLFFPSPFVFLCFCRPRSPLWCFFLYTKTVALILLRLQPTVRARCRQFRMMNNSRLFTVFAHRIFTNGSVVVTRILRYSQQSYEPLSDCNYWRSFSVA